MEQSDNNTQTIGSRLVESIVEVALESALETRQLLGPLLSQGEELEGWYRAETEPPFLIRVLPFIPDLLTRPRKYMLAVTSRRVIIVRMTNPFNKLARSTVKCVTASILWSELQSVQPRRGVFTSSVSIRAKHGPMRHFKNMLRSEAEEFAESCQVQVSTETTQTSYRAGSTIQEGGAS